MAIDPTRASASPPRPTEPVPAPVQTAPNKPAEASEARPSGAEAVDRSQEIVAGASARTEARGSAAQGLLGSPRSTLPTPALPNAVPQTDLYSAAPLPPAAGGGAAVTGAPVASPGAAGALGPKVTTAPTPAASSATSLAVQLDQALPLSATTTTTGRERVLERARVFQSSVQDMAKTQGDPNSPLGRLRGSLGNGYAKDTPIELHGVASHFGPEGLQARVKDKAGKESTFVQDSAGAWVSRPDLQAKHAAGAIPSSEPGMTTGANPSATFGVATVTADGKVSTRVPAGIERFSHEPRAKAFGVGDSVQVIEATGKSEVKTKGKRLVEDDRVIFGKVVGTDGKGNWQVEVEKKVDPGAVPPPVAAASEKATAEKVGAEARTAPQAPPAPATQIRKLSDKELREANNPTILKDGTRVYDASFSRTDAAQKRFVEGFRGTDAAKALEKSRPGPGALPAERAAWERRAIDAADRYLDDNMKYPMSEADIKTREQPLLDKHKELAALDLSISDASKPRTAAQTAAAAAAAKAGTPDPTVSVASLASSREALVKDIGVLKASLDKELAAPRKYWELTNGAPNIGAYAEIGLGQCRHQALGMQTLLQDLGVDARMTRGSANTSQGDYRGEHMWIEATLSDGSHLLVDPTWSSSGDQPGALEKTYGEEKTRVEDPGASVNDYRNHLTSIPARDGKRINSNDDRVLLA